jgi:hypothetical protein
MAARTALTPVALVKDGIAVQGAGATPDATNGNYVAAGPYGLILIVANAGGTSRNLTLRAGGSGNTASGAAAAAVPFEQASTGDNVLACAGNVTTVVPLANTDRYTQADGSLSLDWSANTSLTVYVLAMQKPGLG